MTIHHPKVKKVLRQCERKIMKLIGKGPVSLFILNSHPATIPYEDIQRIVCEVTGVSIEYAACRSRRMEYRTTRQMICFFARTHTAMTYKMIGEKVNRQDHTTVIHSIKRIKDLIESNDNDVGRYAIEINKRIAQLKAEKQTIVPSVPGAT